MTRTELEEIQESIKDAKRELDSVSSSLAEVDLVTDAVDLAISALETIDRKLTQHIWDMVTAGILL